jgi:hypothetical protein
MQQQQQQEEEEKEKEKEEKEEQVKRRDIHTKTVKTQVLLH